MLATTGKSGTGSKPPGESRRALRFLLVVFLLVGYGVASAHSHSHGQTGVSTCTICLVAETAASVSIQSLSSVAVNPEVAFAEPARVGRSPGSRCGRGRASSLAPFLSFSKN